MSHTREHTPVRMRPAATARAVAVTGLLTSAVGIVVQRIAGVAMPAVPPSLVLLVVAALLITALKWRWIPLAGILAAAPEVVAAIAAIGSATAAGIGVQLGTWLRLTGSAAALLASAAAVIIGRRR